MYFQLRIYKKQCMFSERLGAVWITYLFYEVNTNDSQHGLCFPTLIYVHHKVPTDILITLMHP